MLQRICPVRKSREKGCISLKNNASWFKFEAYRLVSIKVTVAFASYMYLSFLYTLFVFSSQLETTFNFEERLAIRRAIRQERKKTGKYSLDD